MVKRLGAAALLFLACALAVGLFCVTDAAFAADNVMCLSCHDEAMSMDVPAVDRDTACASCHLSFAGTHPYHQKGANCGAACHPGWGVSLLSATPVYTDPVSGAAYSSANSKSLPSSVLHVIHSTPRWPANVSTTSSACASCHAAAACNACHTGAVSSTHATHSATGNAAYDAVPGWSGVTAHGVVGQDQSLRTAFVESNQCSSAKCHDLAGTQTRTPRLTEDYNYSVSVNPGDPSGTNASIETSGTWRSRASNLYTGGRMSYNNVAGSYLRTSVSGGRVEIVSDRDPYRGRAEVLLDGVVVGTFDSYAPVTAHQAVVYSLTLPAGAHLVSVRPLGTKSASARGAYVVVDAFNVYPATPDSLAPDCASCHPDKADDHDSLASHDVTPGYPCSECHEGNLATEHLQYKNADGSQFTCKTCHGNTREDVKAAVRSANTACSACHGADHAVNRDFCYGCHTDSLRTYPGRTVADAHAHQTATYGNWYTNMYLPSSPYQVPECSSCHRGHKGFWGGTSTEQNQLCYQCHTYGLDNAYWDPWETGGVVPFKWPSKATYDRTSHSRGAGESDVLRLATDFDRGATYNNLLYSSNAITIQDTRNIVEGKPAVVSPAPSGGGDIGPVVTSWSNYNRFLHTAVGWYWVSATIDLGTPRAINGARAQTGAYMNSTATMGQAVHVYTSSDNVNWTFRGGTGTQGVANKDIKTTFTPVTARYVRVYTGAYYDGVLDSNRPGWEINLNRVEVYEPVASGSWVSSVRDVAQEGTGASAVITWSENRPASCEQTVSTSVSLDGGATWGAWSKVTNGGTIPSLVGQDITNARLRYRVEMKRGAAFENQYLYNIQTRISRTTANALTSYPGTSAAAGSCLNCHEVHGTSGSGSVRAPGNELCFACHDGQGVALEADFTYRGKAAYQASGHGQKACSSCHTAHGYADTSATGFNYPAMVDNSSYYGEYSLCLSCHNSAANSANGVSIQARLSSSDKNQKHNLYPGEWSVDGTRIECTDCHVVHTATGEASLRNPDTLLPLANTVSDPWTKGKTIFSDKDVVIFSSAPTANNGAGSEVVVSGNTSTGIYNRMLLHFPIESVPSTWAITSAKLTLYTKNIVASAPTWQIRPLKHGFEEGFGTSIYATYDVDGATWNEWVWGDGAWTGAGETDWLTPGGDVDNSTVASTVSGGKWVVFDATSVVNRMRQLGDCGIMLGTPGNAMGQYQTFYTRESLYAPKLELTFSGVPQRMIPDGAAFCMSCHDGDAPRDVKLGTATWAVRDWAVDSHGSGVGANGNSAGMDAYGAINKPLAYGAAPLACSLCHDPHGSNTMYHLRSLDGKTTYSIAADGTGAKKFCAQCHELPWHAGHDQATPGYNPSIYDKCFDCHKHGYTF